MKHLLDLTVTANISLNDRYVLLKFTSSEPLPEMLPGQFVEVRVDGSPTTFLRRPISINFVDRTANELWLLVQITGDGTRKMASYTQNDVVNMILPLGNSFTMPQNTQNKPLLIGGGVGIAPMLFWGAELKKNGFNPVFLFGARTKKDLVLLEEFEKYGKVYTTTEDGSHGERGFVTQHSILSTFDFQLPTFDYIYTCGPTLMMKAVAQFAVLHQIPCEASLENTMACGVGVCLCCVTDTVNGHKCVCVEGPVFDINNLKWNF